MAIRPMPSPAYPSLVRPGVTSLPEGHRRRTGPERHNRWIASQVGPELRRRGILFAGLDVIGDYLTEINITSPTCIRELDARFELDIAGDLMTRIEKRLARVPHPPVASESVPP